MLNSFLVAKITLVFGGNQTIPRKILLAFIFIGLTSLTADMVYEGARSVGGSYLEYLGAAPIASAIASSGDLIGYGLRFLSGLLASIYASSAIIWGFTILGYVLTTATLPLLTFSRSWEIATVLYLLERVGKGIRTPARDVILAELTKDIGRGKGFGLHEVMDQIGAVLGPAILAVAITLFGFSRSFLILLIPGILSIVFILSAYRLYPSVESVEISAPKISFKDLGRGFWIYTFSMIFLSLGYVHWMIVSYYLRSKSVLSDPEIAVAYLVAMFVDALIAFPIGYLYDKIRYRSLLMAPISSLLALIILLLSPTNHLYAYYSAALWGLTMGCYETIMRASIADIVAPEKRALAYGVFGLLYGISWTVGAFIYSILIWDTLMAILYTSIVQLISIILLMHLLSMK